MEIELNRKDDWITYKPKMHELFGFDEQKLADLFAMDAGDALKKTPTKGKQEEKVNLEEVSDKELIEELRKRVFCTYLN